MLCRDRCGYCTFAKPPARLDSPYLTRDEVLAHRRGRPGRPAATRPSSPWASGPSCATRPPPSGWPSTATPRRSTTWPRCARRSLRGDRAAPPRQRRRPLRRRAGPAAAGHGQPGDDDRDPGRRPRRAPRRARQGPRAPAGHPRGGRRARHPVHDRDPGRHRRDTGRSDRRRSRPSPRRTGATATSKRSSSRTSCPRPGTAMVGAPACPEDELRLVDRGGPSAAARRRPPPGAAQPLRATWPRCSTPGSTTGAASRRSPPTT